MLIRVSLLDAVSCGVAMEVIMTQMEHSAAFTRAYPGKQEKPIQAGRVLADNAHDFFMKYLKYAAGIIGLLFLLGITAVYFGEVKETKEPPVHGGQEFTLVGSVQARFGKLSIGNGGVDISDYTDSMGIVRHGPSANLFFHIGDDGSKDQRYAVYAGWSAKIENYSIFVEEIGINRFIGQGRVRFRVWEN